MEREAVIGLEIHVQLKTQSKMFCACANIFSGAQPKSEARSASTAGVEPNSAICPICLGYPGTLPVPNRQAIEWTQLVGTALNCELARTSKFDRKSYFYPDLPKGYQISQYDKPFCRSGSLLGVGITRVHLEEDAAKNIHPAGAKYTLVDFNRAGAPLIEIVTEPDIRSPNQAKTFLQELQRIMRRLSVSDADMEKGQLRCDANISLRVKGSGVLNPKTEIKNLNSFRHVERALAYEVTRQTKIWGEASPQHVPAALARQQTRGFDAQRGVTIEQRAKEEASDYRYFPEPDIPPFVFTLSELQQRAVDVPELPHIKRERFQRQFSLSAPLATLLADHPWLPDFFEQTVSELQQLDKEQPGIELVEIKPLVQRAANLILHEMRALADDLRLTAVTCRITAANFAELAVLVDRGALNKNAVPQVLAVMQQTGGDPDHVLRNLGLDLVPASQDIEAVVAEVLQKHADIVAKIKAGKESALQFLVGRVLARLGGRASPAVILNLMRQKIFGR